MRITAFLLSLAVVVTAVFVVPLPYERTVPGSVRPVEDLVEIGIEVAPVDGDLAILTVRRRDVTIVDALRAGLEPGQQVTRSDERLPDGIDEQLYREILAQQFANSFTTAVAVAAEQAGFEVEVTTEVVVTQVVPAGPADGLLRTGDRIRAVDATPVRSSAEVISLLVEQEAGDVVVLSVDREGDDVEVEVELGILAQTGRPGIGVVPSTLTAPAELPFDVQLADANIIGPSAGLMIAVTVADLLLEEDLAAGRRIAGTGTIDGTGAVGRIGSIDQKVETAVANDVDLMLVPAEQETDAIAFAAGRVRVVGVATLADALDALRADGATTD